MIKMSPWIRVGFEILKDSDEDSNIFCSKSRQTQDFLKNYPLKQKWKYNSKFKVSEQ